MYSICKTDVNVKMAPDTPCAQSAADLQAYASAADLSLLGDLAGWPGVKGPIGEAVVPYRKLAILEDLAGWAGG